MARIFISCGFGRGEKKWGDWAASSLAAAGHQVTWLGFGGESRAAIEQAKKAIPEVHAVLAFVHRREDGSFPPGVRDELMLAATYNKPIVAFWQDGIELDGLLSQAVMLRVPFPDEGYAQPDLVLRLQRWAQEIDRRETESTIKSLGLLALGLGALWLLSREEDEDEDDVE